jgi:hypothetical protein
MLHLADSAEAASAELAHHCRLLIPAADIVDTSSRCTAATRLMLFAAGVVVSTVKCQMYSLLLSLYAGHPMLLSSWRFDLHQCLSKSVTLEMVTFVTSF